MSQDWFKNEDGFFCYSKIIKKNSDGNGILINPIGMVIIGHFTKSGDMLGSSLVFAGDWFQIDSGE